MSDTVVPTAAHLFYSDVHGEYNAFQHLLRNCGGAIRDAIDQVFPDWNEETKAAFATKVYYPEQHQITEQDLQQLTTLLNAVTPAASSITAPLHDDDSTSAASSTSEDATPSEATATQRFCQMIKALRETLVTRVHVVGDIYDRGPSPERIMDALMDYDRADIQWGNHDIVWMGAALGQPGCVTNAIRICARYGNLPILEDNYHIDLGPLRRFAYQTYADDPCVAYGLRDDSGLTDQQRRENIMVQKALEMIQMKVEAQIIDENPSFGLESRKLLDAIDYERGTLVIDGIEYEMTDKVFPTVDPAHPNQLTAEETAVMNHLVKEMTSCEALQRHMRFFLTHGALYTICGNELLLHAAVPLNADGTLQNVTIFGQTYHGKALFDYVDTLVRNAFEATDPADRKRGQDLLWYLWLGPGSPLFGKSKMATFERYVLTETEPRAEHKNPFFSLLNDHAAMEGIFADFGMNPATSHLVIGHVPVKVKKDESPLRCDGKVIDIDGGMSRAYQGETGIAGFQLRRDASGLYVGSLSPIPSVEAAIEERLDIRPFDLIQID